MSILAMIKGRGGANGFGYASTAEEVTEGLDLRGRTIAITGVGTGLGRESARVLAKRGARVVGLARSRERAADGLRGLGPDTVPVACDLSDPASVRACVDEVRALGLALDVVLCNAGIMALPKREVRFGQEMQFLTNHVGHFLLVTGLLPALTVDGRVVMLSSDAHNMAPKSGIQFDDLSFEKGYRPWTAYGQSKLANLLFARSLAKRLAGTQQTANALHPGVIATDLGRHLPMVARIGLSIGAVLFMKDIPQGAATQCFVATHPSLRDVSGEYFYDCNVARSSRKGSDGQMAERLWSVTEEIVAKL